MQKKAVLEGFDFLAEYPQFSTTNKRAALRKEILAMSDSTLQPQLEELLAQD